VDRVVGSGSGESGGYRDRPDRRVFEPVEFGLRPCERRILQRRKADVGTELGQLPSEVRARLNIRMDLIDEVADLIAVRAEPEAAGTSPTLSR